MNFDGWQSLWIVCAMDDAWGRAVPQGQRLRGLTEALAERTPPSGRGILAFCNEVAGYSEPGRMRWEMSILSKKQRQWPVNKEYQPELSRVYATMDSTKDNSLQSPSHTCLWSGCTSATRRLRRRVGEDRAVTLNPAQKILYMKQRSPAPHWVTPPASIDSWTHTSGLKA